MPPRRSTMAEDRGGLKPSQAVYPNTVALTHQRGCLVDKLRAAAVAARADVNSPKQVAPEPDMRASSQPWLISQRREHPRDDGLDLDRGRFEIVALAREELDQAIAVARQAPAFVRRVSARPRA